MQKNYCYCWMLCLLLFHGGSNCFAQQTSYNLTVDQMPLQELITTLEKSYGLLFSYEEKLLEDQFISLQANTNDVDAFLEQIFQQTHLRFERVDKRYILLFPKEKRPLSLPSYSFCGRVSDSLTLTPLPYANVYLLGNSVGSTTDEDGQFCFSANVGPNDTVVVSYVGYREYRIGATDFLAIPSPEIRLAYYDFGEDFIVVMDYLTDGVQLSDDGFATLLTPRRMQTLPGKVEPDVLEAVQSLPGISAPGGALANLHIRGGTPDQNLILWEEIPIYHSAHYFGTVSAFNPYAIDEIKVYRGGFGAAYGGRISGVVDLKAKPLKAGANRIGVGTNFLTTFIDGKYRFPKKGGALRISLRRSMTELWYSPFFRQLRFRNQQSLLRGNFPPSQLPNHLSITDDFRFFDTQLKYEVELSKKDQLAVAYLHARNDYDNLIEDELLARDHTDELRLRNHGFSTSWQRTWSPDWSTKISAVSTQYDYDYQFVIDFREPKVADGSGQRDNDITERQLKFNSTHRLPNKANAVIGYQLTNYELGYEVSEKEQNVNLANQIGGSASILHTVFGSYRTSSQRRTGVHLGLRANYYSNTESSYWEPRLQLWHQLSPVFRLQFAAGKYYQFLNQLNEFKGANIGISSPIWILADNQAPVINATHYQGGLLYEQGTWLIDAQFYTKKSQGLSGLAIGFLPRPSQGFDLGQSDVRGFDFLIKKRWGNLSSWLSYSLSNVTYKFPTFFDPVFAAPHQQQHRLHWAGSLRIGRWNYSLSWQIGSGLPYSLLENFEVIPPNLPGGSPVVRPIYDAYNREKLPPQHRANIAINYALNTDDTDHWNGTIGLSLLNIYDQTNTYQRAYFVDNRPNLPRRILFEDSIQTGFTPNFVVRFEWK